jgi:hypothetical protein
MAYLSGAAGLVLILVALAESFEALVLPRRVTRPYRLTVLYYRAAWAAWMGLASLLPRGRRDSWLSVFGPLSLFVLLAFWVVCLVFGFALLQCAVTLRLTLPKALYLSGATFTTLGYGDVVPAGGAGRTLAVVEAAAGFGFFAMVIGYLPVLYQAFSRRETLISLLDARAGSPPSAGRLLLRLGPDSAALERLLERAEEWSAELLESHLSYPMLSYYRSQHDNQSWLAALACILDACALLLTVASGADRTQARLTFAMARHAVIDLALVLQRPPHGTTDRLPPDRLKALCEALRAAGAGVRDDEAALAALAELRALYEPAAAALADYLGLSLPGACLAQERPDNWQTSAWSGRAAPLGSLGGPPPDDHFT